MSATELAVLFFLQMFLILAACRISGLAAARIGQPQVVGEMIAGVILGPSLLGFFFPDLTRALFPPESLRVLYVGAQLGVGLYMFLVGVEFDTRQFSQRMRSALSVSAAGMVAPFALGAGLAVWLVTMPGLFSDRATLFQCMLFMGAALSITALPMLARIIYEQGLTGTSLGTLALAAGAIGDVGAWVVMALVLATFESNPVHAWKAVLGGLAYTVIVLSVGRVLLRRLGRQVEQQGEVTHGILTMVLMLAMLAIWFTEYIGVHAVFGGFLLGIAMPRGLLTRELQKQLEPFTLAFLLPMFFTFSGLKTQLNLVSDWASLGVALVVLLAACLGKGVACWAAARAHGEDNPTAMAIGALMNARGLMELIILNIGLQKGIIQPALFAILVLMAILTTLAATPLFRWAYLRRKRESAGAR
jgi:Kef-type K+ transport system membrane component KefB